MEGGGDDLALKLAMLELRDKCQAVIDEIDARNTQNIDAGSSSSDDDLMLQGLFKILNTADREKLMTLNGISTVRADRIIEIRKDKPFTTVDDLKEINISGKMLDKMIGKKKSR